MKGLRVLLSRILDPFVRARREQDLSEEIQAHLDLLTEEYERSGMSPPEARDAARHAFGGVEQVKAHYRAQRGVPFVDALRQDFGFAVRSLVKDRWVTGAVVLGLALGIGANTAIFSIVDSLLLRTLPVREPERLVHVSFREASGRQFWATYRTWEEIRDRNLFGGEFAWTWAQLELGEGAKAASVEAILGSRGFFDVLGVAPILGRTFRESDDIPGGAVAVLSHGFWQRRFGGSRDILGRTLLLEGVPFTVIGVTPPSFFGPDVGRSFDVALPLGADRLVRGSQSVQESYARLRIMARLEPGQTAEQATAVLRRAQPGIREATLPSNWRKADQEDYLREPLTAVPAATGVSSVRRRYQDPVLVLTVVTVLVLLIACANVATLLLARATGRGRELAIRAALGASRLRLVRQLFVESLLLSASAAALGVLAGHWASRLLLAQMATVLETIFLDVSVNGRVVFFTATAGLVTAVLVGIVPAFRATRAVPVDSLGQYGSGILESRRLGPGGSLVVAQVALSLVLVVGAGLFLRTFSALANLDLGFEPRGLLVADVALRKSELEPGERLTLFQRMCEAARSVPGVAFAACSPAIPIGFRAGMTVIDVPGEPSLPERERFVHKNWITPGWLETFGTQVLAGRDFSSEDRAGAPLVAVVNQAFAQRFLKGGNPIGHTVREDRRSQGVVELTVVGLVEDAVYRSVREAAPPTLYLPLSQANRVPPVFNITVRSSAGEPSVLAPGLRAAILDVFPDLEITIRPLDDQVRATFNQERVLAMLSSVFGGLALVLAALGLYGVTAYGVGRRQREIGIRMALGADAARVLRLVLGRVIAAVSIGIVMGAAIALWAVRFVRSLLFDVPARDPSLFAGAALVLVLTAVLASWHPARRAIGIEPAGALRDE